MELNISRTLTARGMSSLMAEARELLQLQRRYAEDPTAVEGLFGEIEDRLRDLCIEIGHRAVEDISSCPECDTVLLWRESDKGMAPWCGSCHSPVSLTGSVCGLEATKEENDA